MPKMTLNIRIFVSIIFLAPIAALGLIWSAIKLLQGDYLTSFTALGFCLCPLCLGIQGAFTIQGWTTRSTFDDAGTTLKPDLLLEALNQAMIVSLTVSSGLFAVCGYGRIDIPVPHEFRVSIPFMCGAIAVMGTPYLIKIVRRRALLEHLSLTPDEIAFVNAPKSPRFGWSELQDVAYRSRETKPPAPAALVVTLANDETVKLPLGGHTGAGLPVADLVRFYWQHPEHRDELTDGRAIKRLHSETFEP